MRVSAGAVLVASAVFHAVYIMSIFDAYFKTPLVHGMSPIHSLRPAGIGVEPEPSQDMPPASRLVLLVGDGLRADRLFGRPLDAQFLRTVLLKNGAFGVSHTRVPTETRPGHVALCAGFYEDVSAVTKGWQKNPVEFDSVFNRSSVVFSWGGHDVLDMFQDAEELRFQSSGRDTVGKGAELNGEERIADKQALLELGLMGPDGILPREGVWGYFNASTFPPEMEDFGASDPSVLDTWVFDRVEQLLNDLLVADEQRRSDWRSRRALVFVLHLAGLDTSGHGYRPHHQKYFDNIRVVDEGIRRVHDLFERVFDDGRTAYIFTADHGMSDKGAHGDGHPHNTETPVVAWGAGIRKPRRREAATVAEQILGRIPLHGGKRVLELSSESPFVLGTPPSWGLDDLHRSDMEQADLAPLMTALIGVAPPMNSVGVLPIDYLDAEPAAQARALARNALQIASMAERKHELKLQNSIALFFRPFSGMSTLAKLRSNMEQAIATTDEAYEVVTAALAALRFYQRYDWLFLMTVVALGYVGSIVTLGICAASLADPKKSDLQLQGRLTPLFMAIGAVVAVILLVQSDPLTYLFYLAFPLMFWNFIAANTTFLKGLQATTWIFGIAAVVVLQMLVAGFFYRYIYSFCFAGVGLFWPSPILLGNSANSRGMRWAWLILCMVVAVFPLLPVSGGDDIRLVCFGGILAAFIGAWRLSLDRRGLPPLARFLWNYKLGAVVGATVVTWLTNLSLEAGFGLPAFNQLVSWLLLLSSLPLMFFHGKSLHPVVATRGSSDEHHAQLQLLWETFLCVAAPYVLLSVWYESVFLVFFSSLLYVWLVLEQRAQVAEGPGSYGLQLRDGFASLFYLLFCYTAFFGTGNIASISSFEVSSTYRFVTVLSPFVMGPLLVIKIMLPFVLVTVAHHLVMDVRTAGTNGGRKGAAYLLVVAMSDVMTLTFFFLVRDEGSWLDIGLSISFFIISSTIIVSQLLLTGLAAGVVRGFRNPFASTVKSE